MISLTRLITLPLVLATIAVSAAQAQAPGQIPGTLPPGSGGPVIPPPPLVAPAPVPSVVTPLPSPSYGVPRGVTGPVYGGGTIRGPTYIQGPKNRFKKRRHRGSELTFVRQA